MICHFKKNDMITLNLNLGNLKSTIRTLKGKSGDVECIIIPINENNLFKGQKGVYLKVVAFELKEKKDGRKDTHLLKQSFTVEEIEKMTEEQKNAIPLLGGLIDWDKTTEVNESNEIENVEIPADDLPF